MGLRPFACWDCEFESFAGMDACLLCTALSRKHPRDELFSRPEESYRLRCVWVWSWNIIEEASHYGYMQKVKPIGFQEVEAPRFLDNRHMKVVRLSALRRGCLYPLPPVTISILISVSAGGRIMSKKKFRWLSGIETATLRLVAQYLNQLRNCVLQTLGSNMDNILAPFCRPAVDNDFVYFVKILP